MSLMMPMIMQSATNWWKSRGAKIAEQGIVLFMYDRKGKIEVAAVVDE